MFCSNKCLDEGSRQIEILNNLNLSAEDFPCDYLLNVLRALDISDDLEDLEAIYSDPKPTTVFDYDLNNPKDPETRRNMLKCSASLKKREKDNSAIYSNILASSSSASRVCHSGRTSTILSNFIMRQDLINVCNNIGIQVKEEIHGAALFLFGSLLNHSCDPSVEGLFVDSSIAFIINRPIKTGEQLFVSYK
jgi:hypothetical protein